MARASRMKNMCVSISSCVIDSASGGRFICDGVSVFDMMSEATIGDSMILKLSTRSPNFK